MRKEAPLPDRASREEPDAPLYGAIMAGGKGTRFWPRSREGMPKHLLDITGPRTIVQETVDRIAPLIPPERILVVTGKSHADELRRQLPEIPGGNILVEPVGRNTAPCIGWAAVEIQRRAENAVMAVFPADQAIRDPERFRRVLAAAGDWAARGDCLVTIGIPPTGPETGYGYLERGGRLGRSRGEEVYRLRTIREKPGLAQAQAFLAQGSFFWNSGMFLWRVSAIREALARWLPDLHRDLCELERGLGRPGDEALRAAVYDRMQAISIDYGVMEKADNAVMVAGDFGWSDVGSWDALWETAAKDPAGIATRPEGRTIALDAAGVLVDSRKLVALVGVTDLIVVDTDDALLICKRGRSQEIRQLVSALENREWRDVL